MGNLSGVGICHQRIPSKLTYEGSVLSPFLTVQRIQDLNIQSYNIFLES